MAKRYTIEKHTYIEYIILCYTKSRTKEPVAKCNTEEGALLIKSLIEQSENTRTENPLLEVLGKVKLYMKSPCVMCEKINDENCSCDKVVAYIDTQQIVEQAIVEAKKGREQ